MRALLIFMAVALSIFMTGGLRATAAVRCETVFADPETQTESNPLKATKKYSSYAGELNPKSLARNGFRVDEKGILYDLKSKDGALKLGELKSLSVDYLFEWADKESSEAWIKAGRIDYMNSILAAGGQLSGKGYYVSIEPFDSGMYGTNLTSFRQTRSLVVLRYLMEGQVAQKMHGDTDFVRRLGRAGVDALQAFDFKETWLSIISERALQNADSFPQGVLTEFLQSGRFTSNLNDALLLQYLNNVPKQFFREVPENNPYRRFFLLEKMSVQEIHKYILDGVYKGMGAHFPDLLIQHTQRLLSSAQSQEEAIAALGLLEMGSEIFLIRVRKKYSEQDLARLKKGKDLGHPFLKNTLAQIHAEILKGWILEAPSQVETAKRTKAAIQVLSIMHPGEEVPQ